MAESHLLVVVTGGIAAYKTPELVRLLCRSGHQVRCVLTPEAAEFVTPLVLQTVSGNSVRSELFDQEEESRIGHIELADWADGIVVAPATANILAKLAAGIADDLATTLLLATRAVVLVAPAMNIHMWRHPATQANVGTLRERGIRTVGPEVGELACGWEGEGRMTEPAQISVEIERLLGPKSLVGERILVTAGGTREPIDAVRSIANRSSGRMGFAVAQEAARRGAEVVLVTAPTLLPTPPGVVRVDVETALQMRAAVDKEFEAATVLVMAAAVADFRPEESITGKIKKETIEGDIWTLRLIRNPDILAELSRRRGSRVIVGFAAESGDLDEAARRKIRRKGCDLLVANDVSRQDAGFETNTNVVTFVSPKGDLEQLPLLSKQEVAARLLDRVEKLRADRK